MNKEGSIKILKELQDYYKNLIESENAKLVDALKVDADKYIDKYVEK